MTFRQKYKLILAKLIIKCTPGIAQCAELCWQLRGKADKRQVSGAKLALQHNVGLGGAVIVALYKMGFSSENSRYNISCILFLKKYLNLMN